MFSRLLTFSKQHSFFLFGARGVGKSTLLMERCLPSQTLIVNLLDPMEEDRFARHPNALIEIVEALPAKVTHVVIDEIQKVPKLLDVVHLLIETRQCKKQFILTGSSARKLKTAGVNLLAGRAFVYHLFPFSFLELGETFDLQTALTFGTLPGLTPLKTQADKQLFLKAYALTYLKEEIWAEQMIKKLDPFRRFLTVAAQCHGKMLNYSNVAKDVGVEDKTIKNYFSLLEDTLIGFCLKPYRHSFRKRLALAPKFYFHDIGVARALADMLTVIPKSGTSYYGELFESFVIAECLKLSSYAQNDFRFSYLRTGAGVEIDLVVERPGKPLLLVEIKSSDDIRAGDLSNLNKIASELGACEAICLCQEPRRKTIGQVKVWPWRKGIQAFFA